jgi:hypothetical protein
MRKDSCRRSSSRATPRGKPAMSIYCRAPIPYAGSDGATSVETDIHDGRAEATSWVDAGFEVRSMPTTVANWDDADEVIERHHPEVVEMMTAELGCDAVLIYPAQIHSPQVAAVGGKGFDPAEVAHSEYTERYQAMLRTPRHPYLGTLAPSMKVAGVTSADVANATRVATLQLWRNIGESAPQTPLAFCDARTVDRAELRNHQIDEYQGVEAQFETFLVDPPAKRNKDRRWYTFPELTSDEIVLFRTYDSERAATRMPFWTPHTAFVDPTAEDGAQPARGVELKAICLFN